MERAEVWQTTIEARRTLAAHLAEIDPADWDRPSLCGGWSVKDVAAHVLMHPSFRWGDFPGMLARNVGRGYNTMIDRETRRRSATMTREDILADFARFADSHHHVPTTTSIEPMLDLLVHTQDIVRPLGRSQEMPPVAAAVSADRALLLARLTGWQAARKLHLVATDIDWTHGKGPAIEGPMQELLMIATGRAPDPALVSGEGLALVG